MRFRSLFLCLFDWQFFRYLFEEMPSLEVSGNLLKIRSYRDFESGYRSLSVTLTFLIV